MWSWSGWGIVLALCLAVVSVALLGWLLMRLQKSSGTAHAFSWWAITSRGASDDTSATSRNCSIRSTPPVIRNATKIDDRSA